MIVRRPDPPLEVRCWTCEDVLAKLVFQTALPHGARAGGQRGSASAGPGCCIAAEGAGPAPRHIIDTPTLRPPKDTQNKRMASADAKQKVHRRLERQRAAQKIVWLGLKVQSVVDQSQTVKDYAAAGRTPMSWRACCDLHDLLWACKHCSLCEVLLKASCFSF